jgi:hypothetical protein
MKIRYSPLTQTPQVFPNNINQNNNSLWPNQNNSNGWAPQTNNYNQWPNNSGNSNNGW